MVLIIFCLPLDWYYLAFPKDRNVIKALVAFVFAMDTVQTILMTRDCFKKYVQGFGSLEDLNAMQIEWLTAPVFAGIGVFFLQWHVPGSASTLLISFQSAEWSKCSTHIASTFYQEGEA